MATAIHMEARGEPLIVQRAVYDVIQHRAKTSHKTICGVIATKGAFTWHKHKPVLALNEDRKKMLQRVRNTSRILLSERYLFFFHKRLRPRWARNMKCVRIGNMKFCEEK